MVRWAIVLVWVLIGGCVLTGCGIEGLHGANPTTLVRIDPVNRTMEFRDNKDNDLAVDNVTVDGQARTFHADKIVISNNASRVREANAQQLAGFAAQAAANWQGASQLAMGLAQILSEVMPFLPQTVAANALGKMRSITTPGGGMAAGPDAATIAAILAASATTKSATVPSP